MIRLEDIHKKFNTVSVLNGVSMSLEQGNFITLIGRIGTGKSTIMNIICGLVKPDYGGIYYRGKKINHRNRDYMKEVGFLLSGDYMFEDFSTIQYWRSISKLLNINSKTASSRIYFLIELLKILEPSMPIGQLSSGNKMLVKFGTMLLNDPKILIIDEPFVHLDIIEMNSIENILLQFQREGYTILLSTHYPESIYKFGSRLLVLEGGIIKSSINASDYPNYLSFREGLAEYFNLEV